MGHYKWTDLERNFIRENADKLTDEEGAKKLQELSGRLITIHAYRRQRNRMNIVKRSGRGYCKINEDKTNEKGGLFVQNVGFVPVAEAKRLLGDKEDV